MEIQILELKKIPKELRNSEGIINWMRFLGGKNRKELENMAKTDEYIDEAYRELQKLSSEENKLREQIRKKLAKSQTVEEIADILEEDVETVRRLAAEIQSGE